MGRFRVGLRSRSVLIEVELLVDCAAVARWVRPVFRHFAATLAPAAIFVLAAPAAIVPALRSCPSSF